MNWLEKILIEATIKTIEFSFKGAFKIVSKIALFIMFCMYKLIKHYLIYAVPGVFKILWNPKYAPGALITMLLCVADVKFFYKYTIVLYYSDAIHLCIIFLPLMYFYWVGRKLDIEAKVVKKEKVVIYKEPKRSIDGNKLLAGNNGLAIREAKKANLLKLGKGDR